MKMQYKTYNRQNMQRPNHHNKPTKNALLEKEEIYVTSNWYLKKNKIKE